MEPALRETFKKDVYSVHFNRLRELGQWNADTDDPKKKTLYDIYRGFIFLLGLYLNISAAISLYQCRKDFKKVVFNICTSTLVWGIWIKNLHIQSYSNRLNKLRVCLFMDRWKQKTDPEDVIITEKFTKLLLFHRKTFYLSALSLLPLWLITSLTTLVWGPRQLPFSVWIPGDLEDNVWFFFGFIYHTIGSIYIVSEALHADMAMFSVLLQIICQYNILAKNVKKIDKLLEERKLKPDGKCDEVCKQLIKEKFKQCVERQLKLMWYVKELEIVYNKPMVLQFFCGLLLSVANGLELMLVSENFSRKLSYQIGYAVIVLSDVYMYCNLASLLIAQREKVGWNFYDIAWYDMDSELRKYLHLIMMGAQKKQPLTAGKIFSLHRETFLGLLKNIYSWFALFRQLLVNK